MFVQNFIVLSAAVHELSCAQREKKPGREHNTVLRYRADSDKSNTKMKRKP